MKQTTHKILSLILAVAVITGILTTGVSAASSVDEALGEVDIYNSGVSRNYLSVNGRGQTLIYVYFNYLSASGEMKEIPAYCVNPNDDGVPQTVSTGQSIAYLAEEQASDPKVVGIVANGYPSRGLWELGLSNKYEAYYATKIALWCYLIGSWDISNVKVNPNCSDSAAAQRVLAAAKNIHSRGTAWTEVRASSITATPDKPTAYDVTVDGQSYKQQIFSLHSNTWVGNYVINVSFTDPASVPSGTKIVDMDNNEITSVVTQSTGSGYDGQFKILYPADSIEGQSGSVQLSFSALVNQYAVYFAICAEKNQYGNIQNYVCDTDPTITLRLSAYSNYSDSGEVPGNPDDPTPEQPAGDTGLRILKYALGTTTPISGARFEVIDPNGTTVGTFATDVSGTIYIPLTLTGNYTVIEREPAAYYLLSDEPAQNVTVNYGEVSEVTFFNAPYGNLRVEKKSDTGENLEGAVITVTHIESGQTYTETTTSAGVAMFTQLEPGAYRIKEVTAPDGYLLDDTVYTSTVVTGETAVIPIVNKELPGLRILKYDSQTQEALPGVTFEIRKDGQSIGHFATGVLGEILLTDLEPGTYLVQEIASDDEHVVESMPQEIELTAGDGIRDLVFFNDQKPGIHLIKVDSVTMKPIPNARFEFKLVGGSFVQELTSDENGEIDLSKLEPEAYEVRELEAPEGYLMDDAVRVVQIDPNENASFVFTNTPKPTLRIIKVSSDGSPLAGVHFRIAKIEDGSHYLDRITDENGEINITDLEPGVYSVKETATVSDHILDLREYHVELFPGQTSTVTIENQRRPDLIVYKRDADTGEPVPNTVFLVEAADGHSVDEIKTDAEGKAALSNLLPGVYEISEKSVPAPYLMDAEFQLVTLYANRTHTVYFENHKKPTLTVNKVDSVTGSPIQSAKFEVWYGSNNTSTGELNSLGTYFSDENGQFVLELLRDGWYKVTELEPAAGYTIKEPATQEFYIKGGESKTITFENVPRNAIIVEKYDSVTGEALGGCTFQLRYLAGNSGTGGTVIGQKVTEKTAWLSGQAWSRGPI